MLGNYSIDERCFIDTLCGNSTKCYTISNWWRSRNPKSYGSWSKSPKSLAKIILLSSAHWFNFIPNPFVDWKRWDERFIRVCWKKTDGNVFPCFWNTFALWIFFVILNLQQIVFQADVKKLTNYSYSNGYFRDHSLLIVLNTPPLIY